MVGKNAAALQKPKVATMVDAQSTVQQAAGVRGAAAARPAEAAPKPELKGLRPRVQTEERTVLPLLTARVATLKVAKKNIQSASLSKLKARTPATVVRVDKAKWLGKGHSHTRVRHTVITAHLLSATLTVGVLKTILTTRNSLPSLRTQMR